MADNCIVRESQLSEFVPVVYDELRRLASQLLRKESNQTLQPTALVHETYVELRNWKLAQFRSKAEFFGAAAFVMRRILATAGRRRRTLKRGADPVPARAGAAEPRANDALLDVVAIDIAMNRLEKISPEASRVLELRLFGGLTIEEAATVLDISPATVKRRWVTAHAWLLRELAVP
ncbi:MAG: sigma-70 family RNA polymerase sigma factor [Bryobacterales bacterium]|nr:sigma-70 family RNA polymerase sigma factor [Bryobacterales bacterium]